MTRSSTILLVTVLAFMAAAAGVLTRLQAGQRLGTPGVRVVDQPIFDPKGKEVAGHSVFLPAEVTGWSSEPLPVTELELNWLPKDTTYGRRMYRSTDGLQVMASVVLMGTDRTSIHKPEYCITGQGWVIEKQENDAFEMDGAAPYRIPVRKLTLSRTVQANDGSTVRLTGLYVFWFVADGQLTAEHGDRMWRMAKDLVKRGVLERWAYVAYFTQCLPEHESAAYDKIKALVRDTVPQFQLVDGSGAVAGQQAAAVK